MTQPGLAFDGPLGDPRTTGPTGEQLPPIAGLTIQARHASFTGAVHALKSRGEKVEALRQLLRNHGPMTLNQVATITGWPLSSVCSLKSCISDEVEPAGFDLQQWSEDRTTKRTLWRLVRMSGGDL